MAYSESKRQEIRQIFQREIECALRLLQALDMEYEVLAEHHADALEDVVRDKQEKVQQLELVSRQREKILGSINGIIADIDDPHKKHYHFNGDKQITDLWHKLVDVAEKCRDKNRVNGSIVELVSKQSRHALDILQGILPNTSSTPELYDNVGQTTKSVHKRTLVQV